MFFGLRCYNSQKLSIKISPIRGAWLFVNDLDNMDLPTIFAEPYELVVLNFDN